MFTPAEGDGALADTATTLLPPAPPDPPEIEGPSLVDFTVPCGIEPEPTAARGPGVSDDAIRVGVGNDEGGRHAGRSGATMPEAVAAMAEHCNSLGGLAGRVVQVDAYDAAVTELADVAADQCGEAFALVGSGHLEPLAGAEPWAACSMPHFAGWDPALLRPTPMPLLAHQLAAFVDPASFSVAVVMPDTLEGRGAAEAATAGLVEAGFVVVATEFFSVTTEPDWTALAGRVAAAEAGLIHVDGPCRAATVPLLAAGDEDGPTVIAGASSYDRACLTDSGLDSNVLDRLLVQLPFLPIEDGDEAPVTAAFADIFRTYGATVTGDALLAAAAFWEFAVTVDACRGAELTRDCLDRRRGDDWDGAGLHPAGTEASCRVVVKVVLDSFERVLPEEPGRYGCPEGG